MNAHQRRKARRAADRLAKIIEMRLKLKGRLDLAAVFAAQGGAMIKMKPCNGSYWANMANSPDARAYRHLAIGLFKKDRA